MTNIFHLLVYFPKGLNSQCWARLKPRTTNGLPHEWQESKHLYCHLPRPRHMSRRLVQKQRSWTPPNTPIKDEESQPSLNLLAIFIQVRMHQFLLSSDPWPENNNWGTLNFLEQITINKSSSCWWIKCLHTKKTVILYFPIEALKIQYFRYHILPQKLASQQSEMQSYFEFLSLLEVSTTAS